MKPGVQTTEFWGKLIVQLVTVANIFLPEGHRLEVSDAQSMAIVGGMETFYMVCRSFVKGRGA